MKKKEKIIDRQFKGSSNPEISTAIKITIGVIIFLGLVYLIGSIATGKIKLKKEKDPEVKIQYSEILAEQTFKQSNSEYYVLFYDYEDNGASYINAITEGLSETVYKVDLNKKFNSTYTTKEVTNRSPKNASELKVSNPTLIKIKNGKVIKFALGKDEIKKLVSQK